MNLYGLLDAIINKVNRAVKVEQQELDSSLQKQARENINVPSKNEVCNPNLLDNWYFGNPVNQRGQTNYNALGYTIDRWTAAYGDISVSLESDGLQLVYNGSNALIEQYLEEDLTGKTVCFSVLTDMGVFSETKVMDDLGYISPGVIPNIGQVEVYASGGRTIFRIWLKTEGASLKLIAAKLELGDTQTLAHQDSNGNWVLNEIPNYSKELLKCIQSKANSSDTYANKVVATIEKLYKPNLLDNWYFGNPVNQRDQTSYTKTGYTIDRWAASSGSVTVAVGTDSIEVSVSSGTWQNINQAIEFPSRLNGQTVTLSAWIESGHNVVLSLKNATTNAKYEKTIASPFGVVSLTYDIAEDFAQDSDTVRFCIFITQTASETASATIKAAKLEFGDTQTLAHQDSNGTWVLNAIPKYEEELLNCRQYDIQTGEYIGLRKFSQPRNLLDNSDFTNLVNQRGETTYTTNYGFDRWRIYSADTSMAQGSGYMAVTGIVVVQNLSNIDESAIYTMAAKKTDGTIDIASGTFSAGAASGGISFNSSTVAMPSVFLSAGNWVWAALYKGQYTADTLPEYQPKGYAAELAECQRYFQVVPFRSNYNMPVAAGTRFSATAARIPLIFPQDFRISPTMTIDDTVTLNVVNGGTAKTVEHSGISISTSVKNKVVINVTSSDLVSGHPVVLYGGGTQGAGIQCIRFSADL